MIMNRLSNTENIIFLTGGALMVFGTALNFFEFYRLSPWLFLVGAIGFSTMQLRQVKGLGQRMPGASAGSNTVNITLRRLRTMMIIADVLFVVAGLMFVENNWNFLMPLFGNFGMDGWVAYHQYVAHNNWIIVLLIAAILELYSMHRISGELNKDMKKM